MNELGQREIITQERIIKLFTEKLGYRYLGDWHYREGNSNIEPEILTSYLKKKGCSDALINKGIHELQSASKKYNADLYTVNKDVYKILHYGKSIKVEAGQNRETIHFIDWNNPEENDFAIAEEVTINGDYTKRPDIVIYVNGIALGVIELKSGVASIGEGVRQNIRNQEKEFIQQFFSTIQFTFAGNDSEGLRYGTIGTPEKYYLKWKEGGIEKTRLDKYLSKICEKNRFLELIYDFVLFDKGRKKLPRHNQYFAVKAAQEHVKKHEGGIIWHTQGSGKSIIMVQLAKWILANNHDARVVIVTDRIELDEQIQGVFTHSGNRIVKAKSGRELMNLLSNTHPRLICSLIHKFHKGDIDNFNDYMKELEEEAIDIPGELYVFVDECHRTQGGRMHQVMKAKLPSAVFIGFTGTPLLKKDKQTSLEVFGKYIHTYKFNEAVEDEVILDLMYEARDIDQRLSSEEKVDKWFECKSEGLNDYQKNLLKKKWGTMQKVLSSKTRMEKIVSDIVMDFSTVARLKNDMGTALLVATSIFEACKYYELFQKTGLGDKSGIITSYNPQIGDITTEGTGENTETDKEFVYKIYTKLLDGQDTAVYEKEAKRKFIDEPANMKLLIVVAKLLVGFDAPNCSYLYIDKNMQDHGLFQAICRVNRLDSEDKKFGFIIDYKDLFMKMEDTVKVYTTELDYDEFKKEDCEILLKDRLSTLKEKLEEVREEIHALCEPVKAPMGNVEYIEFFCGNSEKEEDLKNKEFERTTLYKLTVRLLRAYDNLASELEDAGYTTNEVKKIKDELEFYTKLRQTIKMASGEYLDLKTYEADMRFLIDNYIQAEESKIIKPFGDMTLVEILVNSGIAEAISKLPKSIQGNRDAVAETIENNVRKKIMKEHLIDPAYYDRMSELLKEIIKLRREKAIEYEEYLKKIAELAKKVADGKTEDIPESLVTSAQRALYNNLGNNEELAVNLDEEIKKVKKADFRGNLQKENEVKFAIYKILRETDGVSYETDEVERIFAIVKEQKEY